MLRTINAKQVVLASLAAGVLFMMLAGVALAGRHTWSKTVDGVYLFGETEIFLLAGVSTTER